jgi:ketosteroid isomerase-like protein
VPSPAAARKWGAGAKLAQVDSIAIRDMAAHVHGDAAIVSMPAEAAGTCKGKPFTDESKCVDLFARRDGRWQVVDSQMTTVKPQRRTAAYCRSISIPPT